MSSLSDSLLLGYERYYNSLVGNGFISMAHVNRLVIARWIDKVISGEYGIIPTDEQYSILNELYQCVAGDCLVPYQKYCSEVTVNKLNPSQYIRVTENNTFNGNKTRKLENERLRTT